MIFKLILLLLPMVVMTLLSEEILIDDLEDETRIDFNGQISLLTSISPFNKYQGYLGISYIPEVSFGFPIKKEFFDFEMSAKLSGDVWFDSDEKMQYDKDINPYRIWIRYGTSELELRIGLQKINFGPAILLRPLQWFNQIDPGDPLQEAIGVYGVLVRYYFLNNANIWWWLLIGNKKTRGLDVINSNPDIPEIGGRIQIPLSRGEIAISLHYRSISTKNISPLYDFLEKANDIPEGRVGIDGKWDLGIGLWVELVYIQKFKNLKFLTYQNQFSFGTDYTFAIGNGLNLLQEHLFSSYHSTPFDFIDIANTTANRVSYPIGLFDNINSLFSYQWESQLWSVLLNYEHRFEYFTSYFMIYYTPNKTQENDRILGSGIRFMIVFNY